MKICAWGNDSGSRFWRLIDPLKYVAKHGHEVRMSDKGINEIEVEWADICIVQSCTDKDGIALLYKWQQEHGKKIVVDSDDGLELNDDSPFQHEHNLHEAKFVITRTMEIADLITTTTPYLADQLRVYNDRIKVLPNYIDYNRWNLPKLHNDSKQIRIGWAGSITHVDDMKMIVEPVKRICKEYKNVQLVIIGDPRVGQLFDGCQVETQNGVPFEVWPSKLNSLRLDIGLAPLRNTYFNRCKSNIKWIEYAACHIPGVFSPTVYSMANETFDGVYGQIAEDNDQWYQCIKNYIDCPELRDDIADRARSCITTTYTLKTNHNLWLETYNSLVA
jgi:glycosyltransferase involved in cell wall biosynthesis